MGPHRQRPPVGTIIAIADAFALSTIENPRIHDERIILIVADDLADNEKNQEKGFIVNVVDGPNLYEKASIDYRLSEVSPSILMDILAGNREGLKEAGLSDDKPVVDSNESDNLYIFLVGHGGKQGLALEAKSVEQGLDGGQGIQFLEPVLVASTLQTLSENRRYRRALLVVEAPWRRLRHSCRRASNPPHPRPHGASPEEASRARTDRDSGVLANEFACGRWKAR